MPLYTAVERVQPREVESDGWLRVLGLGFRDISLFTRAAVHLSLGILTFCKAGQPCYAAHRFWTIFRVEGLRTVAFQGLGFEGFGRRSAIVTRFG